MPCFRIALTYGAHHAKAQGATLQTASASLLQKCVYLELPDPENAAIRKAVQGLMDAKRTMRGWTSLRVTNTDLDDPIIATVDKV